MVRSNSSWASTGGADPSRARPRPSETARCMECLLRGSEGERQASHDTLTGLRLQTVHVVDHRDPDRQSGRIEARTGLRMMPTFPRSPRSFRTAGFPQYGWKAGLSGGAFPDVRGLSLLPAYTC